MATVQEVGPRLGVAPTCAALGVSTASYYRRCKPQPAVPASRPSPPRTLPAAERTAVLDLLHEPRFVDLAPAQVYAGLLDEGRYVCSERTMYRLLNAHQEVRERRAQLRHPRYVAPQLLATRPNQLWSWDITKLLGPAKWTYFYLYVILDVFSRYVVGWMVAHRESAALAEKLIRETCARQGIAPGALTLRPEHVTAVRPEPRQPECHHVHEVETVLPGRLAGALAGDFHRILSNGGMFMYPAIVNHPDPKKLRPEGKLRLMYEASVVAFMCREAGGHAVNEHGVPILDIKPAHHHQRTALYVGSKQLVDDITKVLKA